ncbi:MAG: ExbD/TolR family protein [Gammaproteobacteria bacterium]
MNFRRARVREDAWIDLAPLIDVVFLLLIFFMTSTTFVRESRLRIDLPDTAGVPTAADRPVIELQIDAAGRYAVDGRAVVRADVSRLVTALRAAMGEGPAPQRVVIVADGATPHQAVVRALEAVAAAGVQDVDIATEVADDAS